MGGFGNWVGATMGGEADGPAYNLEPSLVGVVDSKGGHLHDVAPPAPDSRIPKGTVPGNFAQIPGLTSDNSAYEQIQHDIGTAANPGPINWENWKFTDMLAEMEALKNGIPHVNALAKSWTSHGDNLQKQSQDFKTKVTSALSGQWSGASADAAAAATQQVTKTSMYHFTPSSDAISARLKALSDAFASIVSRFPSDANAQLIDSGNFNEHGLNQAIAAFNSEYHLDGSGYLRNNSDGYVAASQAVQQMNQINLSIKDYQLAVQLFRDTYNPTAAAVTENFPNLPTPPDMTFKQPGGGGGGGGGSGGGSGGRPSLGGGGGGLGAGPSMPAIPAASQIPKGSQVPAGSQIPAASQIPTGATAAAGSQTPDLAGLSSLGQGLTSPLQSALGAMNSARAGQAANTGALPSSLGNLPKEGTVALGKGVKGGTGGIGSGAKALAKPMAAPGTRAGSAVGRTVATGSRAGLSAAGTPGAGAPGAGAPAAGQHGAGAHGAAHQPSKVLRNKKNGKQLIGDAEAVVAVLGEPAQSEAPKPEGA